MTPPSESCDNRGNRRHSSSSNNNNTMPTSSSSSSVQRQRRQQQLQRRSPPPPPPPLPPSIPPRLFNDVSLSSTNTMDCHTEELFGEEREEQDNRRRWRSAARSPRCPFTSSSSATFAAATASTNITNEALLNIINQAIALLDNTDKDLRMRTERIKSQPKYY